LSDARFILPDERGSNSLSSGSRAGEEDGRNYLTDKEPKMRVCGLVAE
jgi:hypothetical protein